VAIESRQNYSPLAIGVLQNAYREATRYKSALIGTEHILIAIIKKLTPCEFPFCQLNDFLFVISNLHTITPFS